MSKQPPKSPRKGERSRTPKRKRRPQTREKERTQRTGRPRQQQPRQPTPPRQPRPSTPGGKRTTRGDQTGLGGRRNDAPLPVPGSNIDTRLVAPSDYLHIYHKDKKPKEDPSKPRTPTRAVAPKEYVAMYAADDAVDKSGKQDAGTRPIFPTSTKQIQPCSSAAFANTSVNAPSDYQHIYQKNRIKVPPSRYVINYNPIVGYMLEPKEAPPQYVTLYDQDNREATMRRERRRLQRRQQPPSTTSRPPTTQGAQQPPPPGDTTEADDDEDNEDHPERAVD